MMDRRWIQTHVVLSPPSDGGVGQLLLLAHHRSSGDLPETSELHVKRDGGKWWQASRRAFRGSGSDGWGDGAVFQPSCKAAVIFAQVFQKPLWGSRCGENSKWIYCTYWLIFELIYMIQSNLSANWPKIEPFLSPFTSFQHLLPYYKYLTTGSYTKKEWKKFFYLYFKCIFTVYKCPQTPMRPFI